MVRNVFILGRPGTGKSYIAQLIQKSAKNKGWIADHIYDYQLLQDMFSEEALKSVPPSERSFRPRGPEAYCGFDVINFDVLDTVVVRMADKVRKGRTFFPEENKLFLIEFARNKYGPGLHKFGSDILQDALLLYIKADMKTCKDRVAQRVKSGSPFGHFVSDEIMEGYYMSDDWLDGGLAEYLAALKRDGIHVHAEEIDNMVSGDVLDNKVEELVSTRLISELAAV
jgi:hypothetical protein